MEESVARFRDRYIKKTISYGIPEDTRRWYIKHAEAFITSHPDIRLQSISSRHVDVYLDELARNPACQDWQFKHVVDALRILFVDIVKAGWALSYQWEEWRASESVRLPSQTTMDRLISQCIHQFDELFNRLSDEIRVRHFSMRTEQAYCDWAARFILFSNVSTVDELGAHHIAPFLEYLAVQRNVAVSTQRHALNALLFFFRHVLKIPIEETIDFVPAKKSARLPVEFL